TIQADRKIVVLGTAQIHGDYGRTFLFVSRYDANGARDPSFGDGGEFVTPLPRPAADNVAIRSDGEIVITGSEGGDSEGNGRSRFLFGLSPNGTVDQRFALPANVFGHSSAALQADGKIIVPETYYPDA